jgi:hypothetical protein
MVVLKIEMILFFTFVVLANLVAPVSAADSSVGVIPGDYVKYGNAAVSGPEGAAVDYDWLEYNVTMVSGTDVTIIQTGMFKNGTPIPGNGNSYIYNLEKSTMDGILIPPGPIIAANLQQGDNIASTVYNVTRTEIRTYMGLSRIVNILELSSTSGNATLGVTLVYDRTSGILLEEQMKHTDSTGTSTMSYNVTETNLFGSSPTTTPSYTLSSSPNIEPLPSIPEFPSWIILALVLIATISTALIIRKKHLYGKERTTLYDRISIIKYLPYLK